MFNAVIENVIQVCLNLTVEDQQVALNGVGENVHQCLIFFYANNGMVGSRYSEWLQHSTNFLIGLFRGYGLEANVTKYCMMTCQHGALSSGMSD